MSFRSDRNLIDRNRTIKNEDGILIDGVNEFQSQGNVVQRNAANANSDDGIDVRSSGTTLTANKANRNGDLGIEAVAGVTDGGRNRAHGNGNPLQCVNVRCR